MRRPRTPAIAAKFWQGDDDGHARRPPPVIGEMMRI
jgi:hypothetical protein